MLPVFDDFGVVIGGAGVLKGHIADEVGAGGAAVVHGGRGLGDLRAAQQGVFDFAQLDALPAQFDLGVGPTQILSVPAGVQRTRSPVRYIRAPASASAWGLGTNRSAVNPTRPP